MNEQETAALLRLLYEIRDNQAKQLEFQSEIVTMQREHNAMLQKQRERTERLQDRAEQIQTKSAQLVSGARKLTMVLVPIVVALLIYVSYFIFRR